VTSVRFVIDGPYRRRADKVFVDEPPVERHPTSVGGHPARNAVAVALPEIAANVLISVNSL
jgi:hypothetical protein